MFELGQLNCFVAVATELNFRRAAVRLNMTQPPLSRQIQLLEHQLGVLLLERTNRSVRLTAAGRAFFVEAQSLLEHARLAALSAQKIARGDIGSVSVSFVSSAVYEFLPKIVAKVQTEHPDIDVSLRKMPTFEQLDALRTRRIDLGIVRSPMGQQGFESECLLREPFVLAIPRNHPLAAAAIPTIHDLDHQPFIMYSRSGWRPFHELLVGMFRAASVTPKYVQFIGSTLTILALVNAGMGVALVPKSASCIRFDDVVFRQIALDPGILSELHLMWRNDNDNPAFPVMLEAIRRHRPCPDAGIG